jgi:hypothetical protein
MSAVLRVLLSLLTFMVALTAIIALLNGHLGPLEIVLTAAASAAMIAALLAARSRLA